jgi:SAM-dependent methyltransferase
VFFDDFSERYARFNELRDRLTPEVGDWVRSHCPGGGRAVDLGCGEGRHTAGLADRYAQVLAVDVSDRMLELARARHQRPNIRYERRSVLEVTPRRDGVYDAVLSVHTLHHVAPLPEVLPHVRDLVAAGGRLVLVDIVDPGGWGERDWHVEQAFAAARGFYQLAGGDPDAASDVIRLMLHPRWLDMMVADRPPSREEFHRHASAVLPGAVFHDGLHPVVCAAAWQAPPAGA